MFLLPSIQVILFCAAIGATPRGLDMAVLNQDTGILLPNDTATYLSLSLDERAHWQANPSPDDGWTTVYLSHNFLNLLPTSTITQVAVTSMAAGLAKVQSGACWGVYYMDAGFSVDIVSRYSPSVSNETIIGSQVQLTLDNSNEQISITIQQVSLEAYQVRESGLSSLPIPVLININCVHGHYSICQSKWR